MIPNRSFEIGYQIRRVLRYVGQAVVLVGHVDGGYAEIGWLGAVCVNLETGNVQPVEPLVDAPVRTVARTEERHRDIGHRLPGRPHGRQFFFLVDGNQRAHRISLDDVRRARIGQLLCGHCGLQVRESVFNGEVDGQIRRRGDYLCGVTGTGGRVDVVVDDRVHPL